MDKVRVIEKSLSCFRCGMASLIPVIGLVFVHMTLSRWLDAREASESHWNPARAHLWWGFWLAIFGSLISLATVALIFLTLLQIDPFD